MTIAMLDSLTSFLESLSKSTPVVFSAIMIATLFYFSEYAPIDYEYAENLFDKHHIENRIEKEGHGLQSFRTEYGEGALFLNGSGGGDRMIFYRLHEFKFRKPIEKARLYEVLDTAEREVIHSKAILAEFSGDIARVLYSIEILTNRSSIGEHLVDLLIQLDAITKVILQDVKTMEGANLLEAHVIQIKDWPQCACN